MPARSPGCRVPEASSGPPSSLPGSLPGPERWDTPEATVAPMALAQQQRVVYGDRVEHTSALTPSYLAPVTRR
jgi:hypothetical protein